MQLERRTLTLPQRRNADGDGGDDQHRLDRFDF